VTEAVIGKPIDGNSLWYKADDNMFYWSGGIDQVDILIPGIDYRKLSIEKQYILASEAMEHFYDILASKVPGFTGMSVTLKTDAGAHDYYVLVIQVSDAASALPANTLSYCGYAIPVDHIITSLSKTNSLGRTISRIDFPGFGSAGFITTRKADGMKVLVTNYHVACADLMMRSPRTLSLQKEFPPDKPEVVMPCSKETGSEKIGVVLEGRLDRFNDIAVVALNQENQLSNRLPSIGVLSGIRTLASIITNFKPLTITVKMFGGKSGFRSNAIVSFNSRQPIEYLDGLFVHTLRGLIQVTLMAQPGDSGSAVVDMDNRVVGILVASDSDFSYLLPIENVLSNFNLNEPI
jgi:hypothetical protein